MSRAEDERAVAEVEEILNDLIVMHPMWIGDDGTDLDYLPEREAQIANFIRQAAEQIAPLLAAAHAEAWDEGYARGARDECSDLERADNPYRTAPSTDQATTPPGVTGGSGEDEG